VQDRAGGLSRKRYVAGRDANKIQTKQGEDAMNIAARISIDPAVTKYVSMPRKNLINGKWVDAVSGKTFPVYDPSTGDVMAHVAEADATDVNLAVKAARKAFDEGPWPRMSPSERGRIMWKIADLIEKNAEEFAQLEAPDNGKPVTVARAADIPLTIDMFRYMAGWATKITGTTIPISFPGEYLSYTLREPVGVVAQIIPWNFPLLMAAWKLAPALATGCTLILKVAEQTPLTGLRLGELMAEAGLPDGVVNVLAGYGETAGAALAAHDDVDKVAFTGSTEVGKLILKAAAGNLKKVSLELGGKSPVVVLDDADLDAVIPGAGVADQAKAIKVGPGLDPATQMGPLVSDEQYQRVTGYIKSGVEEGAEIVTGGKNGGQNAGYFVEPTLISKTDPKMKVVREEIFGTVVCASPITDADLEAIAKQANNTNYGLAASVWTRDISKANKLAKRIRAGSVWINCHNVYDASLPFGGYKESGWGREMGEFVLNNYTEVKAVTTAL
jgi:phenylacetaldehyde dehydrogenase